MRGPLKPPLGSKGFGAPLGGHSQMAPPPTQSFRGGFPGAPRGPTMGYPPQMGYPQSNMTGYPQRNMVPMHMPVPPVVQEQSQYENNGSDIAIFDIQQASPQGSVMEVSVRVLDSTGAFSKQSFFSRVSNNGASGPSFDKVTDTLYNLLNDTFWITESSVKRQRLKRAFQAVGAKAPTAAGSAFISDIARKALSGAQMQDFSLQSLGVFFGYGMVSANTVANTELVFKVLQSCAMVSLFGALFESAKATSAPEASAEKQSEEKQAPAPASPAQPFQAEPVPIQQATQAVAESAPVMKPADPEPIPAAAPQPWADVTSDGDEMFSPVVEPAQEPEQIEPIPVADAAEAPAQEPAVSNSQSEPAQPRPAEPTEPAAQPSAPAPVQAPAKPAPKASPRNMWGAPSGGMTLAQRLAQNASKPAPIARPTVRRSSQNKPSPSPQGEQAAQASTGKPSRDRGDRSDRGTPTRTRTVPVQPRRAKVVKKDKDGFQTISRQKQVQPERFKERKYIVKQLNNAITRNMRQEDEKFVWISYDGGQKPLIPRCIMPIRWEHKSGNKHAVFMAHPISRGRPATTDVYFAISKVKEIRDLKFTVELPTEDDGNTGDDQ